MFIDQTSPVHYSYALSSASTGASDSLVTITIAAPGLDDDPAPDVWTIDQAGALFKVSDDVIL